MNRGLTKVSNLNVLFWNQHISNENEFLFEEIEKGLKQHHWKPFFYDDPQKARHEALKEHVDCVVLDLKDKEGKLVGLDILKYLRTEKPFLPIIIFSRYYERKYEQEAMREDASYYLTIPITSYHELMYAIKVAYEREKSKERQLQGRYYETIGKLSAGVAHFIKNALWNISSRAQYLLDQTEHNKEAYELLETIDRRCDDANQVVINLLNFAKRDASREVKNINSTQIIENVIKLVTFELKKLNIHLVMNVSCTIASIKGNEFELKEAFLNIVRNAFEAMPKGGKLTISVDAIADSVFISIADTGEGMTEDVQKKLFIPYFTTKKDSTGFGLFDTRRIIHNHKGTINVESKYGKGTTITMSFPLIAPCQKEQP